MSATQTIPRPAMPQPVQRPKVVLWKWSLLITAIVLAVLMWQCGSALLEGRKLANGAVRHFHEQLNAEEYEQILQEAADGFTRSGKHEDLVGFLQAVHTKLGGAESESLINLGANSSTNGTFITSRYNTKFDRGAAAETFTWIRSGANLKLYGYNVQSNALLKRFSRV
jgi:hypothetical protein